MLTQTAEYALRAMCWLALQPDGQAVRAQDLATATDIPSHYLSKIMRRLVVARLLVSQKGRGGGFVLARPAAEISFCNVLDAVDAAPTEGVCAFGWGDCDEQHPCPMHGAWSELSSTFRDWAKHTTLADIDPLDPTIEKIRNA